MSLQTPLINIVGMSRYDLPALTVLTDTVKDWQKFKNKVKLTDKEFQILVKSIKSRLYVSSIETNTKNMTSLKFSKAVDSIVFNNILRDFINNNKICKKCRCPEVVDYKCDACGFVSIDFLDVSIETKTNKPSKQEKRLKKIEAQQNNSINKKKNKKNNEKNNKSKNKK